MPGTHIGRKVRRYREIVNVLITYGFGIVAERTHLLRILKHRLPRRRQAAGDPVPVRIRKMLEDLGPTFVKLGQVLSTRPDLLPFPLQRELEKLQDAVAPLDAATVAAVIREELGHPPGEIFASFDPVPVASASVAQVHRAILPSGETVAVKIQRPGIERVIETDLLILRDIAALVEKFIREAELYQPSRIVDEFERMLRRELDFSLEGRNIERFRRNFADDPSVRAPRVHRRLTRRRVLVLDYVEGTKVSRIDELRRRGIDPKAVAAAGARSVLKQIFSDGFFHGDPHPGNIFVAADGALWYLDFGIVGRLDDARREEMMLLFTGFLNRDPDRILRALSTMGAVGDEVDARGLRREIGDIVDRYHDAPLGDISLSEVIEEEFEAMRRFRLRIPADLSLLARALMTTEGVGLMLDPEFNLTTEIRPFAAELMRRRLRPREMMRNMRRTLSDLSLSLREAPGSVDAVLRALRRGYVNIAFEHKGLHDLTSTIDKSSNRIAFGLITAALLISSALIMVSGKEPTIYGFPAFGVAGYVVSGVLGLWLILSILRGGSL